MWKTWRTTTSVVILAIHHFLSSKFCHIDWSEKKNSNLPSPFSRMLSPTALAHRVHGWVSVSFIPSQFDRSKNGLTPRGTVQARSTVSSVPVRCKNPPYMNHCLPRVVGQFEAFLSAQCVSAKRTELCLYSSTRRSFLSPLQLHQP